jgi:hypothetical protein
VRQARRAQHRAGDAQGHAAGQVEVTDADHAALDDGVLVDEQLELADALADLGHQLADLVDRAGRQVLGDAAGADVGVVHPQAGDHLDDLEDPLALAETDGHDRRGAHLHATGADAHQVRGDPGELHHEDPDD